MANAIASQVQALYVGYLGRAADQAGLDFWTNAIANGTSTIESVALGFTLSQEYQTQYAGLNTSDLVGKVYENVLGRAADADGLAFWVGEIEKGVITADTLVASIVSSLGAIDQTVIDNKVFVANAYTAAAGSNYSAQSGASVIANVTGDPATVSAALEGISSGVIGGSVTGLNIIQGLYAAQKAVSAFEASNAAAVNKFVADFKADSNVATAASDALAADASFSAKLAAAKKDADDARIALGNDSLTVVTAKAADAQKALDAVVAKLTFAEKDLVNKYNAAVAADKAATGASAEQEAAAKAGLGVATGFVAALAAAKAAGVVFDADTGAGVWNAYVGAQAAAPAPAAPASDDVRAKIADAFKDVAFFSNTFKPAADAEYTDLKAEVALTKATGDLNASTNGPAYIAAANADAAADKLVADVTAADAVKSQVDALADQYEAANKGVTDFTTAVTGKIAVFNAAGADTEITDITGATLTATAAKETFYFQDKIAAVDDVTIGSFAKGDAIYLGEGIAFNSGALSTGNNSALEFFLIQDGADAKLVIETSVYGSANTNLEGVTASELSPDAAVITLTGVSIDDLQVSNGAIIYA
ncbi:DUF4214 domain-containing protein [Stutzerimonas stutzeri]|uniref:DUF4214 domain-containing protein n=1 Tax=Stutzerimonas stutzeri TaxID=316 RepID=UPI003EDE8AFC